VANFVKTTCVSRTQTRHTTAHSPGGGLPPSDLHFRKTLVELMLSSNRHVTPRLTVFQIPGIWFLAGQNSRFLGSPGVSSQRRPAARDWYVPSCKFSCRSARHICPRAKHTFFLTGTLLGATIPCYIFLESCRRADFKL